MNRLTQYKILLRGIEQPCDSFANLGAENVEL